MDAKEFEEIFDQQTDMCRKVLVEKAKEYADDTDRLRNFKISAALQNETPREALAGMMAKHTTSIYDMCSTDQYYDWAIWNEKLSDHMNYLYLLRAIIVEENRGRSQVAINKETLDA